MQLDIRSPIGWLFTLLGIVLTGFGVLSDSGIYARSLGHNVNLEWGVVILAFGLLFLWLARRGARTTRAAATPVAAAPAVPVATPGARPAH